MQRKPLVVALIWLHSFSLPQVVPATNCADLLFLMFQDGRQQNIEITKPKL